MLNPNIEIKKWFYTHLVSATSLSVYDGFAPDNAGNEYIILDGTGYLAQYSALFLRQSDVHA